MDFLKRFWNDKVSLILLIVFMVAGIGYFTGADSMGSPLLFIAALNVVYSVNESGRFLQRLQDLEGEYPGLLHDLGLHEYHHKKHWFEIFVQVLIYLGSLFVIGAIIAEFIR